MEEATKRILEICLGLIGYLFVESYLVHKFSTMISPEYWLRGPVPNIPPLLQPVAHALLQARDEITDAVKDMPDSLLWKKPGGSASVAFHIQHVAGVIDRLFTYARQEELSALQMDYLKREGKEDYAITVDSLLMHFSNQVNQALQQLQKTLENSLLDQREVGRKKIPSNVIGLLFHAAEHVQRHTGQLLVTVKIVSTV